ncbi:hypothetical protein [uncultured Thiodictyon sp.]|uniref:hypothetical protein n=1 Tax=uncultured Thiodictyon sp. TaxID=1846217 RepID=UPI0025F88822|nr:hypothetical protein [uncultured Thiodictyon sp.]
MNRCFPAVDQWGGEAGRFNVDAPGRQAAEVLTGNRPGDRSLQESMVQILVEAEDLLRRPPSR